jgi:glycosyltransferase involved in cell wall biosynthesis
MKKILMISYYYPPLADVGGLRACAFSKYLPDVGWEPYVISVKNPDKEWCILGNGKPPEGVKVFYTWSLINLTLITGKLNGFLSRILSLFRKRLNKPLVRDLLCIPDQFVGWIPLTFFKGLNLIRKNNIDVIYVSCKPFSSGIIGALLKFATKRPLVLDFRDPVSPLFLTSNDRYYKYLPPFPLIKKIEEVVLRYANRLILVTEETRNLYLSYFPFLLAKTNVIYNGFMEAYYSSTNNESFEKFSIVYSGNFYAEFIPPDPFFKALQRINQERGDLKDRIQFLYVGENSDWLKEMVEKYGLDEVISVTGHVPRQKSIEYICKSSVLLLRMVPPMISTKLFEGLAAGVPILALINKGEVEQIIRKYSEAPYYIVRPDDSDAIAEVIRDAYEKWENGELKKKKNSAFYQEFNKRHLTARFAGILNELLDN